LVSHLHFDHFDRDAIKKLWHEDLTVCGPKGIAKRLMGEKKFNVVEMSEWDSLDIGGVKIHAVPAKHTFPPPEEINFVIEHAGSNLFFGGDCKFSYAFQKIRGRFRIDAALVPVSGTLVFGRRVVMSPEDAVKACEILEARVAIPIHPGGVWLSVPPFSMHPGTFEKFREEAVRRNAGFETKILEQGEEGEII
ncbi:MAG: MBL fold metallo-hydrolase, partial [Deltaproteobacteria bacterium]|nr:MBL fold metallo-hydrolase [Deltaproteobacteria bacterium]